MNKKISVTVLVENSVSKHGLKAEHGLSFLIRTPQSQILFDTGQTDIFADNASRLSVDLHRTDAIVLSHGHYDHTGGLKKAMEMAPGAKVFFHPAAMNARFSSRNPSEIKSIGIPPACSSILSGSKSSAVETVRPTEIADGVWTTGEIPIVRKDEVPETVFFLNKSCTIPDPIEDDQALYFHTDKGVVLLLGCAHSGLINTLEYVKSLTGRKTIHAVFGGMHLLNSDHSRISRLTAALLKYKIKMIGPAHCTGLSSTVRIWNDLPNLCVPCMTGSVFEFVKAK